MISLYRQTRGAQLLGFLSQLNTKICQTLQIHILMLRKMRSDVQCFRSKGYRARDVFVFPGKECYLHYFQDKKRDVCIICWYFTNLKSCIFMPEPCNNHLNLKKKVVVKNVNLVSKHWGYCHLFWSEREILLYRCCLQDLGFAYL